MEDKRRVILFRFLAYLVDFTGLNFVGYTLQNMLPVPDPRIFVVIRAVIVVAYMVLFTAKLGQTPGKCS